MTPTTKKSTPKTARCDVCGNADAPIHVAPDGVARIGDHGSCSGQGRGLDG